MADNVFNKKPSLDSRDNVQSFGKRILFTGPDGIGDYRPRVADFPRYIGESPMAQGETGDLEYLWRPPPGAPPFKPKHCFVGAVGWGLPYSWALNERTMQSNMQIKLGEFRTALEERMIYNHHNPWQPPPTVINQLPAGARGRLAWDHETNDEQFRNRYRQTLLNKNKQDQNPD